MTLANVNPLVAALDAAVTAAGVPFGDSDKPTDTVLNRPYVVAFFNGGTVTDRTMKYRDGMSVSAVFHSYAQTPDAVRVGRQKVLSAVFSLGGTTQGGWLVHLPVHEAAMAIERDDKLSPPLYWQTDDFSFRLTPA